MLQETHTVNLEHLGWNAAFESAFADLQDPESIPARVSIQRRGEYRVLTDAGECTAEVSGRLRHSAMSPADLPVVGDWVAMRPPPSAQSRAVIRAVLPRASKFSRQVAGDRIDEQVVASNVDTVFLVSGLDLDFNLRRVERALTLAWGSGAVPVIILNKADLRVDELDALIEDVASVAIGVPIHALSALEDDSIDEVLAGYLNPGKTIAFIGSSGVGKSTLINRIIGDERQATGAVREADSRGRHTTTHRELIPLPGGAILIDTPGMRELQVWGDADDVDAAFKDIEQLASKCKFSDCNHEGEPGCAVIAAIDDGELDEARLHNYHKLQREMNRLTRAQSRQLGKKYRNVMNEKRKRTTGLDDW